jgi:hypothetical protein
MEDDIKRLMNKPKFLVKLIEAQASGEKSKKDEL